MRPAATASAAFRRATAAGPAIRGSSGCGKALRARRLRVRERLAARYGEARLAEIEREADAVEDGVYRTGCDLDDTAHARTRYLHMLERLERLAGVRG